MTRIQAGLAILLLALATPLQAQVNALPSLPHLLVKGEASRDVLPDRFTVEVTLAETDARPARARDKVQANAARVLAAFERAGALADSVNATTFSIGPEHAYENDKRVFKGTRASRSVRGTFASAEAVQAFLGLLDAGESVLLSSITPAVADEAGIRAELKGEAMAQTRETARLLASSYGARLGGLYSVSDVAPSFAYGIQAGRWPRSAAGSGVPAPPGEPPVVFDEPSTVDAVAVSGSRITRESLAVGTITLAEHLYAVFLLAE